jgi:formate dehydrogenase accessory protein FdhD|tara:strand:+ start:597 stop:1337 length:741 start_codon:yes stop_codon:yes gene_type:complete
MSETPLHRLSEKGLTFEHDNLADESIIAIYCNGEKVISLLASAHDLTDLGRGHVACEGYGEVETIRYEGNNIYLEGDLNIEPRTQLLTAACGACGDKDIDDPVENTVGDSIRISITPSAFCDNMQLQQKMFAATGGTHCAALCDPSGEIVLLREDIGRHNAVDKVIGAALNRGLNPKEYVLALSGRAGWELIAKSARMAIEMVISVGAMSDAAAELARNYNITLVAFARGGNAAIVGPIQRLGAKD